MIRSAPGPGYPVRIVGTDPQLRQLTLEPYSTNLLYIPMATYEVIDDVLFTFNLLDKVELFTDIENQTYCLIKPTGSPTYTAILRISGEKPSLNLDDEIGVVPFDSSELI